jgi:uncharacterized membrane protein YoaK (UPF0700 family)
VTTEHHHHVAGTLGTAIVLALLAGFVDAFVYLRVAPVFIANMSGNLVHLGMGAGEGQGRAVAAAAVALGGFLAGVFAAVARLDRHVRAARSAEARPLLIVESMLLAIMPITMWVFDIGRSATVRPIDYLVVAPGATAMGVQAIALRRVGQIAVATTYGTGAVVRLGEKIALATRRAPLVGETQRSATIVVLGVVLASYVIGAAIAASLRGAPVLLLVAAAVPLAVSVVGTDADDV